MHQAGGAGRLRLGASKEAASSYAEEGAPLHAPGSTPVLQGPLLSLDLRGLLVWHPSHSHSCSWSHAPPPLPPIGQLPKASSHPSFLPLLASSHLITYSSPSAFILLRLLL